MKTSFLPARLLSAVAAALLPTVLSVGTVVAKTELLVYTAVEADELAKFKREFEKVFRLPTKFT